MTGGATWAALNFAANRDQGGVWSNLQPELRTQALAATEVMLADARALPEPPSLTVEGFVIADSPAGEGHWRDAVWIEDTYVPSCLQAVRVLTGADHVAPFHPGVLLRDTGDPQAPPAADFVHLDHTRESALPFLAKAVAAELRARFPRFETYNVWRAITPPPQDVPLALCDQRSHAPKNWVVGRTVEPTYPEGVPYVASIADPGQRWFYVSDLGRDEAIVFKGYDSDPSRPFGCLHGAFRHPQAPGHAIPRASVEMRVFALYAD